ncbi:PleD family two-component system response regulator [Paralimibaculum aggregatum]|uniref:diguanylate cyclase n=1 Tax=Paralimibaculum aggregatum TaxID=3036245 RepID=A0ABQ6LKY6_9RHOB|nr:PleD family two-component system response regulator [Limibaculum sp. NKW23]GMG83896.1 PleD family two-component system response regulator [Limibaculum sp. NKW23]
MPGRILIVDDVPSSRLIARAKLSMAYYDVIEAETGEEAIDIAAREEPDLILLDVMMPGIDGFETCRRLKTQARTAHIPVVMLSSLSNRADRVRGLECGADDFLTKPFDDTALLSRVSSLTRMKMMIDELRLRAETSRELGLETGGFDVRINYADASILFVCNERETAEEAVRSLRTNLGAAVETARGERELRALMKSNEFDAFVIGTDLADGDPLRIASLLRGRPNTRQAALIMMFAAEDRVSPPLAMDMGVPDYLLLPMDYSELAARLRVQLRRKHYSDQLRKSVQDSMVMAVTDPLTGLYNRRYANAHIEGILASAKNDAGSLVAMVLDLDRFKSVNDTHGHAAGDRVLVEFASRLQNNFRPGDLVSRIGGEEFLVVMPDILPANAERVAERVRHAVETPDFVIDEAGKAIALTVSIGIAAHLPGESSADLIARADAALYASKAAGRNTVTLSAA